MGIWGRKRLLSDPVGKTEADFVDVLGSPDSSQSWGAGHCLVIWRTWRGSFPVLFDEEGKFVRVTKL